MRTRDPPWVSHNPPLSLLAALLSQLDQSLSRPEIERLAIRRRLEYQSAFHGR